MTKFASLFSLLIALSIVICGNARTAPPSSKLSKNDAAPTDTYVCNSARFADLGLDMNEFPYCNTSLSYEVRVKDLIDSMTLWEKVRQLGDTADGVRRLGLAKYDWWSEALHGVSSVGQNNAHATFFDKIVPSATSFPTVILTSASFNETLWKTLGQVISTEARAMHNLGHAGLTFWSPNVNVVRDPRWGRILETPGEDPFVVGRYATNFVRGLQDVPGTDNTKDLNTRPLKVAACCKHYAAYDLESWYGVDRWHFDARVSEQDMEETFRRPFEMCVKDGDVTSVMCSFNRVNGIPSCADTRLLKDTVRGEWNLHGYIVADCDSIDTIVTGHKWLGDTREDAVAQTLKAGLDLDCGSYYTDYTAPAIIQGRVKEAEVDKALKYLYVVLMRLGFFDGSPKFSSLGKDDICSKDHIELATEAARQGIVLLKNEDQILPLNSDDIKSIALIGPHANATEVMIGNYAGPPCQYTSPLNAFKARAETRYEKGCEDVNCDDDCLIPQAVEAAKNADATVVVVGLDLSKEAEGGDRVDLLLPGFQTQLVNQVASASKGPVILVVMSGGAVDITFARDNPKVKAILWAGYPGEEGGRAIADIVFGDYNPGGKLPLTWYKNEYVDQLPMTSMSLRPIDSLGYPGRTYKFFNGSTVFPFGYGLSYTEFKYTLLSAKKSLPIKLNKFQQCREMTNYANDAAKPACAAVLTDDLECKDELEFEIQVQNVGNRDGSEVVMVYKTAPQGILQTPIKDLIAFERVVVAAGKSKTLKFALNACQSLSIVDYSAYHLLPSGNHTIMAGDGALSFPVSVDFTS